MGLGTRIVGGEALQDGIRLCIAQGAGAREGPRIGFTRVDEDLQQGSIGFEERYGNGLLHRELLSLLSISNWTDY